MRTPKNGPRHRERRRAYLRLSAVASDESTCVDERLLAKLTKIRKLTWREERRHVRRLLRGLSEAA